MCHRIDERVMLLIAPDLANQKGRVQHNTGDDDGHQQNAKEEQDAGMPFEDDPTEIEEEHDGNEPNTKRDEECNGSVTARNYHATRLEP
jgi:hypothetical protein